MTNPTLPHSWSNRFGLARSPMFEVVDSAHPGDHHVLLDGGNGSFGLSVVGERVDPAAAAAWAWSSDLPHHVAVSSSEVQVVRWDEPARPQLYSLDSVNRDLDGFYNYLCRDRLRSNRTVVQHLVNLFGRVRNLTAHSGLPDDRSIDAFVTILADMITPDGVVADTADFGLPTDAPELLARLAGPSLEESIREIRMAPSSLSALTLYPSLAIRHAGGQLFQEAHFDLVRAPPPDMFGYVEAAMTERNSRGGTHFTPPALARSIVDYTLAQIVDLPSRPTLTICDPACGSAAFLHEALRGLRRSGFNGSLKIVGYDISPAAIAMARFTLKMALRDWTPRGDAVLELSVGDSLAAPMPAADIIVMNPPFISVIAQTAQQKDQLRAIIGDKAASRGDYSMAFVTRALDALNEGGALGTLFPANLLTHEASTSWRASLARTGDVRMLANIGDFGLFSQALVHVACAVIAKTQHHDREFTALVTDNEPGATGDALRELRKAGGGPPTLSVGDRQWKLFAASKSVLDGTQPWRILTPQQRAQLDALEAIQTPTVASLFSISQGVQTGALKIFLLSEDEHRKLPAKERRYFRKALMTDSIRDGRIVREYYLFFPHTKDGPLFANEAAVETAVPSYYRTMLKPNEDSLRRRAAILRANRTDWWGLMHPRVFSFETQSRIVSKFFGAEGSFVLDLDARYLPSTGHVWTPRLAAAGGGGDDSDAIEVVSGSADVMRAYVSLLNSRIFTRLVSYRSVTISGGQFDLSSRFVGGVMIPNLWERATDSLLGGAVRQLAAITMDVEDGARVDADEVDRLVARLYGVPQLAEG